MKLHHVIAATLLLSSPAWAQDTSSGATRPQVLTLPDQASDAARTAHAETAFGVKGAAERAAHAQTQPGGTDAAQKAASHEAQKTATAEAQKAATREALKRLGDSLDG